MKDIKKFIKYYDEPGDNVVLTYLGKMGILEKDLIPIILLNTPVSSPVRERLVLACGKQIITLIPNHLLLLLLNYPTSN